MKRTFILCAFGAVLAGCGASGGDIGAEPPPPAQPLTEATLSNMPPEASASVRNSQAAGSAMAQQYNSRYK